MKISEYIEAVKLMQKEGISENIICRILEEEGKDRRTETMEYGKNKRTGTYIISEEPEKTQPVSQKQESKALEEPIREPQYKALMAISKTPEGEDYLKSKGVYSEENIKRLTKKQAWRIQNEFNKLKE